MKNKHIIILFALSLLTFNTFGAAKDYLTIEPIVGYERVQKLSPTPHTKNRLMYGLRANFGPPLISMEAQLTQANDTESFPEEDLTIKEEVINAMLGIRSNLSLGVLGFYLRAGGHARKSKLTTTKDGETTEKEPAIRVSPYAGTGISINAANILRANAGVTAIFTGKPKGSDREYQTTLGFAIKI